MSNKSRKAPDPLFVLRTQRSEVTSLCFGSVGTGSNLFLYSGGLDGYITVWNLETRRSVGRIRGHEETPLCSHPAVQSLFSSSVGLISQGRDGSVKLWDYSKLHSNSSSEQKPISVIQSDCTTFVSCCTVELSKTLKIQNIQETIQSNDEISANDQETEEVVSLLTQQLKEIPEISKTNISHSLAVDQLAANRPMIAIPTENSEQVDIWDVISEKVIITVSTNSDKRLGMAMSLRFIQPTSDDLLLAATFEDGSIFIWSINQAGQPVLCKEECFTDPALCCAFNAKLTKGIVAGASETMKCFNFGSGCAVVSTKEIALANRGISKIEVRSDEKLFATAGWDHRVRLFSLKSYKPLAILKHHTKTVHSLAFSSDKSSNWLASGGSDSHIAVWSLY